MKECKKYQEFAKYNNVNIILGSVALKSNISNKNTNTCFLIDRKGDIVGRYDKKYMYKVNKSNFIVDETTETIPGTEIGIFELDNVKIGIGICFDLRFPEYFRELIKQGAQVIFLPSHFRKNTGEKAWDILVNARAIENQVYFCACNQTGIDLCGKTKIVSYTGDVIKQMGEGILMAELNLREQENLEKNFLF